LNGKKDKPKRKEKASGTESFGKTVKLAERNLNKKTERTKGNKHVSKVQSLLRRKKKQKGMGKPIWNSECEYSGQDSNQILIRCQKKERKTEHE